MKNVIKRSMVLVIVLLMLTSLFACNKTTPPAGDPSSSTPSDSSSTAPSTDGDKPWAGKRIGIAHISLYDEWCKGVYDEFMEQGPALGFGEINVQDANGESEPQQKQVENFIAQDYDILFIDPVSPGGIVPALQGAGTKGIPVIAFDSSSDYDGQITHIAWDHAETGVLTAKYAAKYAKENLDGKIKVAMLESLGAPHTAIRSETFRETLEAELGKENIEYVYQQDFEKTRENATNIVSNNIAKPVDIIWCAVDNAAFGAKVALETNKIQGTKIISAGAWGVEPFSTIYEGDPYYLMCIGVSPKEIVKLTLESACKVFEGKGDELPETQNIQLSVIDASNIEEYMKYVPDDVKAKLTKGENVA